MRKVVFSMDIEDWYHLDYFDKSECDRSPEHSMLDGIRTYLDILKKHNIRSNFFVVGEIASSIAPILKEIEQAGHEIGTHTHTHRRPLSLDLDEFSKELLDSKSCLEGILEQTMKGFRAPCFSLDRDRLERVREAGYTYDSSRIDFSNHPLYGSLDLTGFEKIGDDQYRNQGFHEFEVSTLPLGKRRIPVSGGGYLRLFPWLLMKWLLIRYLKNRNFYVLYIHPFELSSQPCPPLPPSTSRLTKFRFGHGRRSVPGKLEKLIVLLKNREFEFTTFADLCES